MLTFGTTLANGASSQPDLKALLAGMDRASRLYLDAALRFTCDETITQSIPRGIHVGRYQYIFVYDAREGFKDYRMRAGRGERPAVDPAREGFRILQRSYFWVLVFQGKRQAYHRYAILGEASWGGASVLLLRFEPIPPYREGINEVRDRLGGSLLVPNPESRSDQSGSEGRLGLGVAGPESRRGPCLDRIR